MFWLIIGIIIGFILGAWAAVWDVADLLKKLYPEIYKEFEDGTVKIKMYNLKVKEVRNEKN